MSNRKFKAEKPRDHADRQDGIMEKLLKIKIEGPEDFSRNVDAYLNGDLKGEQLLADGEDPR